MAFINPTPILQRSRRTSCTSLRRPRACATPPTPTPPTKISGHSLDNLLETLREHPPSKNPTQTVHLVGVGPGDPGMLTLSALRHMNQADIVLYDRLVTPEILSLVNPSASMVYVGKEAGFHTRTQDDIHLLLTFFASSGKRVVRLKGGDPLVFGRGGEEIAYLKERGFQARSVPGITAAAGIAADLGIPLTMRGVAHSVRFITGHAREGRDVDIGDVDNDTTYVIYMGLGQLPSLVESFVERGVRSDIPAAAVERGTTNAQRAVATTLNDLCEKVQSAELKSPTLIFVGEVVKFARVWGVESVVEGALDVDFEDGDVFGVKEEVLQRAFEIIDRRVPTPVFATASRLPHKK